MRIELSVGRITGSSRSVSASVAWRILCGVPCRPTGCSATRWATKAGKTSRGGRFGRQHHVERKRLQRFEQDRRVARAQDDLDLVLPDDWGEEAELEVARQRRERARPAAPVARAGLAQDAIPDSSPAPKIAVGVIERDTPASVSTNAARGARTVLTEPVLQRADLARQCGLRDVQSLRRAGQIAVAGDLPEVAQMMVVQVRHRSILMNDSETTMYFI